MRKFKLAALAGLAALSMAVGFTGTANAGVLYQPHPTHCAKTTKTFNLPYKPDMTITMELCIERASTHSYFTWIDYAKWSTPWYDGGAKPRFYYVHSYVHGQNLDGTVVRGPSNNGSGQPNAEQTWDFNEKDGSRTYQPYGGWGCVGWSSSKSGWFAGANVYYDIVGDGKGEQVWHLHPTLSF